MPLYKDYYKCLSIVENTKKNGEDYLYLKLQNKETIIDGYLWNNIHIYKMSTEPNLINSNKKPLALFEEWFEEAKKTEINDPNAMNLATISSNGKPSSRIVLLK